MKTIEYAKENGFVRLTSGYNLPKQQWMLDRVIDDATKNNKEVCLVETRDGVEVWQKRKTQQ